MAKTKEAQRESAPAADALEKLHIAALEAAAEASREYIPNSPVLSWMDEAHAELEAGRGATETIAKLTKGPALGRTLREMAGGGKKPRRAKKREG